MALPERDQRLDVTIEVRVTPAMRKKLDLAAQRRADEGLRDGVSGVVRAALRDALKKGGR